MSIHGTDIGSLSDFESLCPMESQTVHLEHSRSLKWGLGLETDLTDSWKAAPAGVSQPGAHQMHPEDLQVPDTTQEDLSPPMRELNSRLALKGPNSSRTTGPLHRRTKRQPGPTVQGLATDRQQHALFRPCPSCARPVCPCPTPVSLKPSHLTNELFASWAGAGGGWLPGAGL